MHQEFGPLIEDVLKQHPDVLWNPHFMPQYIQSRQDYASLALKYPSLPQVLRLLPHAQPQEYARVAGQDLAVYGSNELLFKKQNNINPNQEQERMYQDCRRQCWLTQL